MKDRILIDTNLWIYLYALDPQAKRNRIEELVQQNFAKIIVSTQILGEFYHVVTRKGLLTRESANDIIIEMVATFPVSEIGTANVLKALKIQEIFHYSYWDSLVMATAILTDCDILYSEDMQHGQSVQGRTRIINPFLEVPEI
ncbi:MAG: PIN domain-containing protein [Desulfomonilaceae bacterium]